MMISLVTNACALDHLRLPHTLPHYLRVFGERLGELVVVLDDAPAVGRIADHHRTAGDIDAVRHTLAETAKRDRRVRIVELPTAQAAAKAVSPWFQREVPYRCQVGTPILAFVYAMAQSTFRYTLRCDCDMLFFEDGWLDEGLEVLQSRNAHLITPPRLGNAASHAISTRALLMDVEALVLEVLPLPAYKTTPLRRLHRWMGGRSPYLALEQMLDVHAARGLLSHVVLKEAKGFSVHAGCPSDFAHPTISSMIAMIECGEVPPRQLGQWEFVSAAWSSLKHSHCPRQPTAPG